MGLKTILDSLDNVPAELHDHYKEVEGKFVLDLDDDVKTHPSVAALSNAYRQEQTKRRELTAKLEAANSRLEGLPDDFDADKYEELRQQAEGKQPPKTDEQVAQVRKQLETKHNADLAKKDERIAVLEGQIGKLKIDDGLSRALDEANIDPVFKQGAMALLKSKGVVKLVEEDGEFKSLVETDMGPMPIGQFVKDWSGSEEGKVYVGKPKGLDTNGSDGRKSEPNPWAKDTHNLTTQGAIQRADPAKARRMMKAAGISDVVIDQRLSAA